MSSKPIYPHLFLIYPHPYFPLSLFPKVKNSKLDKSNVFLGHPVEFSISFTDYLLKAFLSKFFSHESNSTTTTNVLSFIRPFIRQESKPPNS